MKFKIPEVPIAFFDLDDTLTTQDTNSLWLSWRVKEKKEIGAIFESLVGLHNYYYYKKGSLTDKMMFSYYKARTLGLTAEKYTRKAELFFNERGRKSIFKEAEILIEEHHKKNINTVLITGQDDFLTKPFSNYLNLSDYISNKRIKNKSSVQRFETPNCYGFGKIELAQKYVESKKSNLSLCSFYSDSISDLPLLEAVGYPVVVNPDNSLKKIALEKNWPIINFNS